MEPLTARQHWLAVLVCTDRGFLADHPVLQLDEPTSSLNGSHCAAVFTLSEQACDRVASRLYNMRAVAGIAV